MTRIGSAERGGVTGRGPLGGINRLIQDSRPPIKDDARAAAAGARGRRLREGGGLRRGGVARRARHREPELAAALAERITVEPEQPGGPQLVATRQRERVRQQRALQHLEGLAMEAAGPHGDEVVDEARDRVSDEPRHGPQLVRAPIRAPGVLCSAHRDLQRVLETARAQKQTGAQARAPLSERTATAASRAPRGSKPRARARTDATVNGDGDLARPPSKGDRKSTRLNSSHLVISYAVFCLKKK